MRPLTEEDVRETMGLIARRHAALIERAVSAEQRAEMVLRETRRSARLALIFSVVSLLAAAFSLGVATGVWR